MPEQTPLQEEKTPPTKEEIIAYFQEQIDVKKVQYELQELNIGEIDIFFCNFRNNFCTNVISCVFKGKHIFCWIKTFGYTTDLIVQLCELSLVVNIQTVVVSPLVPSPVSAFH